MSDTHCTNSLLMFGNLRMSSATFGNCRNIFRNPGTLKTKISRISLRKSWQVYQQYYRYIKNSEMSFCILQEEGNRITWDRSPQPFTCVINAPEKKSKFKGMKSFIAYNIIPSVSDYNSAVLKIVFSYH